MRRLAALLLSATVLVGCGGKPVNLRPAAIASETFSIALKGLQAQFVTWSDSGLMAKSDERRWQASFKVMAQAGLAIDAAIVAGDQRAISDNAESLTTLVDTLLAQEVVKLPASQQQVVRVAITSIRGFLAIWRAVQTPTQARAVLGSPTDFRAIVEAN